MLLQILIMLWNEDSVSLKTEQICQSKIMHIYEKRKTNYKHTKQ